MDYSSLKIYWRTGASLQHREEISEEEKEDLIKVFVYTADNVKVGSGYWNKASDITFPESDLWEGENLKLSKVAIDIFSKEYKKAKKSLNEEKLFSEMSTKVENSLNTSSQFIKKKLLPHEEKFYFTFGSSLLEDGLRSYVKILATDMEQAKKIMFESNYGEAFAFSYSEKEFKKLFSIEKMNCVDIFSQLEKDYILEHKNEFGNREMQIVTSEEIFDLAEELWPEPEEEFREDEDADINVARMNYLERETNGESRIIEMLQDYEGYKITDLDIERKKEIIMKAYVENPKVVSEEVFDLLSWDSELMKKDFVKVVHEDLTDRQVEKASASLFKTNEAKELQGLGWKKAEGTCGLNVGERPVYGKIENDVALFAFQNKDKDFWHVAVTGLMTCGGETITEATKSAEKHISNSVSQDYDERLSEEKFNKIMKNPKRNNEAIPSVLKVPDNDSISIENKIKGC